MEVHWLDEALHDLERLQDWYLERDPEMAGKLVTLIRAAVDRLDKLTDRGRPGRWPQTRELVIPSLGYVIPYRVRGRAVEILRVFHGAQAWPAAEQGLP